MSTSGRISTGASAPVEQLREAPAGQAPASGDPARRSRRGPVLGLAEAYALVVLTVLLAVFFAILPATSETFPTIANLQATAGAQAVPTIIAVGCLVPLICEEYDLSIGPNAGLASVFAASALSSGWSIPAALGLAVAIGGTVGVVNGLIITRLGVNSLVATLGTSVILVGFIQLKSDGETIVEGIPAALTNFGYGDFLGIPSSVYVALAFAVAIFYLLRNTPFGRYLYAIGANRDAARLVGLDVNRLVLGTFVLSGLLCGAAGLLQVAVSGAGNPRIGDNFTLPALAAAFLSVAAIKPGRYNVWGAVVAITFLAVLNSGLNLAGADNYVTNFANGGALVLGVALAAQLGRRSRGAV